MWSNHMSRRTLRVGAVGLVVAAISLALVDAGRRTHATTLRRTVAASAPALPPRSEASSANPVGAAPAPVADAAPLDAGGVPVVDTMGVRGGKIHSMEEFLIVDSLKERAALSALTILRLATGAA